MASYFFDHAATTPMRQVAIDAWAEHAGALNAGGQYSSGRAANAVLSEARETIAELLGADPVEVVFTGSGTEADNIAVSGLYRAAQMSGGSNRVVSTPIEHPGVLEPVKALAASGAQVDLLHVGATGHIDLDDPANAAMLAEPAAVATMMWANNETGAIQPVERFVELALGAGTPTHVDAVQVVGHLPVNFHALGVTTLAASAHKFGGPKGVGLLLARRSPAPAPILFGGGQERGLRSGTVDVAGAAATAAALKEAAREMDAEATRLAALCDRLIERVPQLIPDCSVTTAQPALPGHAHFTFPGANGDAMIMLLDVGGVEASTGSACNSGVNRMSHVLEAMGCEGDQALGALRFTLGRTTGEEDVDKLLALLPGVIEKARVAGAF